MSSAFNLKKCFITNNIQLYIHDCKKVQSIDEIETSDIKNYVFFLHFDYDDEYLYHIDKIYKNRGRFVVMADYSKKLYITRSNKNTAIANQNTLTQKSVSRSHYYPDVHGNICQAIEQTKHLDGVYVEIGVFRGTSALTALNYMKVANQYRKSYFLDTYDGFNYEEMNTSSDTHWIGTHIDPDGTSKMEHIEKILREECPLADICMVKSNICTDELPSEIDKISLANVDVDALEATAAALEKVAKKVVIGGIILAEDATSTPALIGAFYAMEEFLKTELGKHFMKLHLQGQYFLIRMN